jgi:hypothetical protein
MVLLVRCTMVLLVRWRHRAGTTRRRSRTMNVAADTTSAKNAQYAHPERLGCGA